MDEIERLKKTLAAQALDAGDSGVSERLFRACTRAGDEQPLMWLSQYAKEQAAAWAGLSGRALDEGLKIVISREKSNPLKKRYELTPHKEYSDVMELDDFIQNCKLGGFIDYDGVGYYATATHESTVKVRPSEVMDGLVNREFTHVAWYNR